jgi:hypothetical protein
MNCDGNDVPGEEDVYPPCVSTWYIVSGVGGSKDDKKLWVNT